MNSILRWVLESIVIMLIKGYDKFGKEIVIKNLTDFWVSVDEKLEKKFGKDIATNLEKEILDVLEEQIVIIKKEIED